MSVADEANLTNCQGCKASRPRLLHDFSHTFNFGWRVVCRDDKNAIRKRGDNEDR
jgi:hypothetical protein